MGGTDQSRPPGLDRAIRTAILTGGAVDSWEYTLHLYSREVGVPSWELRELPADKVMPDMAIWMARTKAIAERDKREARKARRRGG